MRPEDYPEEIARCLRVVWLNKDPCRYQPESIDGGLGWHVWDFKLHRAVPVDELKTFTFEQITEKLVS